MLMETRLTCLEVKLKETGKGSEISDLHHHNLTSINLGLKSLDPGWDIGNHGNRKYTTKSHD